MNTNIENLLRRQQEGTLTPDELNQLNQLTHRDTVLSAATQRASLLRHRRMGGVAAVVAVALVGGLLILHQPSVPALSGTGGMTAQTTVPALAPVELGSADSRPAQPAATADSKKELLSAPAADEGVIPAAPAPQPVEQMAEEPVLVETIEPSFADTPNPVVACNTQCEPDSVINDIWKFLRA